MALVSAYVHKFLLLERIYNITIWRGQPTQQTNKIVARKTKMTRLFQCMCDSCFLRVHFIICVYLVVGNGNGEVVSNLFTTFAIFTLFSSVFSSELFIFCHLNVRLKYTFDAFAYVFPFVLQCCGTNASFKIICMCSINIVLPIRFSIA